MSLSQGFPSTFSATQKTNEVLHNLDNETKKVYNDINLLMSAGGHAHTGSGSDGAKIKLSDINDINAFIAADGHAHTGNGSDGAVISYNNLSDKPDALIIAASTAQGDILYRGASGFERLPAGTSGQVLKTNGENANPAWVEAPGNPVGTYIESASPTAPAGYLECIGGVVSRITYANLFSLIGTTYGVGDGSTTFKLPDRRDRFALSKGATYTILGATGGEAAHVLTVAEMPSHTHGVNTHPSDYATGTPSAKQGHGVGTTAYPTQPQGGGTAHNNMPPYFVVNYYIKY